MSSLKKHLSEEERHRAADGTLEEEQREIVSAHLARCANCAADVARLQRFMKRVSGTARPTAPLDELWPTIRQRIEHGKVVALGATPAETAPAKRLPLWWIAPVAVAAAVVIAVFALPGRRAANEQQTSAMIADTGAALVSVVDSAYAYEREAQILLDRLELQRALLRPDARQALDRDLHVVDVAIAELKDAVAHDPANPALRQLLAASYKQKVDLLKRASNAS